MTLFISCRRLDTKNNTFTDKVAAKTRYVSITGKKPGGKWSAKLLDQGDFVAACQAEANSGDVLIYVHGFNTKQKDMLDRHKLIEDGLSDQGFKGAVVSFDWPSEGKASIAAYKRDLTRKAAKVSKYLVTEAIKPLLQSSWAPRVHLICHSMGAFITLDGFEKARSGAWEIDQVLLVAGDAHRNLFRRGTKGAKVLRDHSKRVTNYYSNDDAILTGSTFFHGKTRVGQKGLPPDVDAEHIDLYGTARYRRIKPEFDDDLEEDLFSHRWWFEDERFLKDAALTLQGKPAEGLSTRSKTNLGTLALKR